MNKGYSTFLDTILVRLGITDGVLPVAGVAPVAIDDATFWVDPLPPHPGTRGLFHGRLHKRSTHRVKCTCPVCGRTLSAGRLRQHRGTLTCLARVAGLVR